jgi:hypothetical protein
VEVYSIGFTKKTAEQFFGILGKAGIRRLLDVRLKNASQLAGFSKREDLEYFLRELCAAVLDFKKRIACLLLPKKSAALGNCFTILCGCKKIKFFAHRESAQRGATQRDGTRHPRGCAQITIGERCE